MKKRHTDSHTDGKAEFGGPGLSAGESTAYPDTHLVYQMELDRKVGLLHGAEQGAGLLRRDEQGEGGVQNT